MVRHQSRINHENENHPASHNKQRGKQMRPYFTAVRISKRVIRITGITQELMYLVIGETKAALIDTGIGIGDLATFVRTLTDKPIEVILTHGHLDHIGGATFFSQAYLNEKDWPIARQDNTIRNRLDYLSIYHLDPIPDSDQAPVTAMDYLPLNHGDRFDLGEVTLELIALPGHTPGSMTVLIEEERSILFGDACNTFTFLFDVTCSSIYEYLKTLEAFKSHEARYDRVYLSHGGGDVDKAVLDGVIKVCQDVLNGQTDAVPYDFLGFTPVIAKAIDSHFERIDHGLGNLVYNQNHIR